VHVFHSTLLCLIRDELEEGHGKRRGFQAWDLCGFGLHELADARTDPLKFDLTQVQYPLIHPLDGRPQSSTIEAKFFHLRD
jgi:hypothetical protein